MTPKASGETSRRFLFVMQYPGYLRYFDSVVRSLAARGHHVDVAFDSPGKQAEGAEALEGVEGVTIIEQTPLRSDVWAAVAPGLRGLIDYVRYLHPCFADAPYLRTRMRTTLPRPFAWVGRWQTSSVWVTRLLVGALTAVERAVPSAANVERYITEHHPDAVLVTPLVTDRCPQVDFVKSAQALGIPVGLCVASWDHLTTKGLIRVQPDLVSVWNEEQRREAVELHGTPLDRIVVTGAQPFDRWFERRPSDREAFCRKAGLNPARPFILFVGSTASISSPDAELRFVRRWIEALRQEPSLADVGVLLRPHPYNAAHWREIRFDDLHDVAVYPRTANPVNESDRQDYFDSLHHSAAVVGVNTTALIEAAIAGRTVHTVLDAEFRDTQGGTLHFRYLLAENGGFLRVATSLSEHARQIAETLESPEIGRAACERFISTFIRPRGRDVAATPVLTTALEELSTFRRRPTRMPLWLYPVRGMARLAAAIAVAQGSEEVRKAAKRSGLKRKRPQAVGDGRRPATPGAADATSRTKVG